jgi:hypothetical protein
MILKQAERFISIICEFPKLTSDGKTSQVSVRSPLSYDAIDRHRQNQVKRSLPGALLVAIFWEVVWRNIWQRDNAPDSNEF